MNSGRSNYDLPIYAVALLVAITGLPLIYLEIPITYIAVASICSTCLIANQIKNAGFFNPLSLFLTTALPYIIASPIDILFFENTVGLEHNSIAIQSMSGLVFIVSTLTLSRVRLKNIPQIKFTRRFDFDSTNTVIIAIAALNSVLVASYFSLEIGSLTRSEIYSQKPVIYDLFKLFSQCTIIFLLWQSLFVHKTPFRRLRGSFVAIGSILFLDILIVGDRRMAVVVAMIICYYYSVDHSIPRRAWVVIFTFFIALLAYGGFRNLPPSAWLDIYSNMDFWVFLNPVNLEFGAFPRIWTDMIGTSTPSLSPTYLSAATQIIPSSLLPERSLAPSIEYVKTYHPDIYAIGGGLAFNALVESILNFGHAGPAVIGAIFGLVFSQSNSKRPARILLFGILIYCLCFTMRNDFTSTLRFLIIAGSVCSVYSILFNHVSIPKSNH